MCGRFSSTSQLQFLLEQFRAEPLGVEGHSQLERGPGQRHPGRDGLSRRRPGAPGPALGAGAPLGRTSGASRMINLKPRRCGRRRAGRAPWPASAASSPSTASTSGRTRARASAARYHHLARLQPYFSRAVGDLATVGGQGRGRRERRRRAVHLHDPDHLGQRPDGVGAPHAGDPGPRGLGRLARPRQHRHRGAGQAAGPGAPRRC